MEFSPLGTFRQRLEWTRSWLGNNYKKPDISLEDTELVDHADAESSSHGVESLSSVASSDIAFNFSEYPHVSLDDTGSRCGNYERFWSGCHPRWTDTSGVSNTTLSEEFEGALRFKPEAGEGIDHETATAYELAGRREDTLYKDLRSAFKARKRDREDREKYYHYRGVKRGQRGTLHYATRDPNDMRNGAVDGFAWHLFPANLSEAHVFKMTPRHFWEEAQSWPRPPTYHRRSRWVSAEGRTMSWCKRDEARKHAHRLAEEDENDAWSSEFRYLVHGDRAELSAWEWECRQQMHCCVRWDEDVPVPDLWTFTESETRGAENGGGCPDLTQ